MDGSKTGRRPVPPERSAQVRKAAVKLEAALAGEEGARPRTRRSSRCGTSPPGLAADAGARRRVVQGYNAQNVVTEDSLVIATRLTSDTTDYGWYEPMISDAMAAAAVMAAHRPPGPESGEARLAYGFRNPANQRRRVLIACIRGQEASHAPQPPGEHVRYSAGTPSRLTSKNSRKLSFLAGVLSHISLQWFCDYCGR